MNRLKFILGIGFLLAMATPARSMDPEFAKHIKYSLISVRSLKLEQGERISGFKLKLQSAYIYSAPVVPVDWTLKIVNDGHGEDPWIFVATGNANHGLGSVSADFFRDFMVIGVFKPTGKPGEVIAPFDMELEITIELDHVPRKIVLRPKDMVYKPFAADRVY
jgi:hypothetical protein